MLTVELERAASSDEWLAEVPELPGCMVVEATSEEALTKVEALRPMEDEVLFSVATVLGFRVRVTKSQWARIASVKHPVVTGKEDDVRLVLSEPDEVRQSKIDPEVFLFYRLQQPGRWLCSVAKKVDNDDGFVITAYPTDAIKEGERLWTK